ncbi:hypothetical protein LDENG_00298410 [Lucifuga dentata]|nr:hypothetical protein LDENG_00298410 [Lucifuga dentata]
MDFGEKLKELNITQDEINRFTKAFKDEKFRGMLRDYAAELSDPENRKKYEEEIKLLEKERGSIVEFIHPEPFKALKTSVNGKQKCYINICSSDKVGKPECRGEVSEDGRRGQRWSIPHSLHPGREDRDTKGNKIVIYDVIFHPDTLHMAHKNKKFMHMVDNTAIRAVQDVFKVVLDQNNMTEMKTKYKGIPQPCVSRKPVPGFKANEPSEESDPLAFPYPDVKRPTESTETPKTKNNTDSGTIEIQPDKTKKPTKPTYTVKYRSFIDMQDFRYSRDSAQSPRPKEIVITFDVPLLKLVDTNLEVQEKTLLLESKTPAYRLEVPLAYPVDEDKGEAKFNKQKGQLTVTLPVLPSKEALDFAVGLTQAVTELQTVNNKERQEEKKESGVDIKENSKEQKKGGEKPEEEDGGDKEKWMIPKREGEKGDDESELGVDNEKLTEQKSESQKSVEGAKRGVEEEGTWKLQMGECQKSEEMDESGVEEKNLLEQKRESENSKEEEERGDEEKEELKQERQDDENKNNGGAACTEESEFQCDTSVQQIDLSVQHGNSTVFDNMYMDSNKAENLPILTTAEPSSDRAEDPEVKLNSCSDSAAQTKSEDTQDENGKVQENVGYSGGNLNKVESDVSSEESHSANRGSKEVALGSGNREDTDEDDLTTEQIFKNSEHENKPLVLLREIDEDGNEMVISDHSTSAGFIFQNSLMYELD